MAPSVNRVLAQIQRWTAAPAGDLSDAELLKRYVQQHDQAAFAALVARYGGLVLRVCRRILGGKAEVEDAFQAVFLVLARKAASLRQPEALAGWLHSVARRVAWKARTQAGGRIATHAALEETLLDPHPDPLTQLSARELLDVVDAEVQRLPPAQRSVVLLCCLEGHSREEAAKMLGWTPIAVKNHLQRGRRRLQERLARRGISLTAALALVSVSRTEAAPVWLLRDTITAAPGDGIGGSASALAHSVLKSMFLHKLAGMSALVLMVAFAASAALALVHRTPVAEAPEGKTPSASVARNADAEKPQSRTDAFGDPLPDGAIRRLGTLRFRHGGNIHNLLLTPDGKTLVSNDYYGTRTVCVWDVATGKLRHRLPGTFDQRNISLSPDGKLVAIGQEKAVILWDLASGKEVRLIAQADVTGTAFSPDGKLLAAAGLEPDICLWDLATGKSIARWPWRRDPTSTSLLAFTPDGKTLIAGQQFDSKIVLWDTASGKKRQELDAKTGDIFTFALSPDGALLATGSRTGGASLWDMKTGKLIGQLQAEGGKECVSVAFSPNGKILATTQRDAKGQGSLFLWDVASGKELPRIKSDLESWHVVFARDGKTLIVASNGAIRRLDAATGKEIGPTAGTPRYVGFATMSPEGRTLAYDRDDDIRFWDMKAGREIGSLDARPHGLLSLAFSPDGRTVAAGVGEYAINLWDTKTRKPLRRLQWDKKESPHGWWARGIAFSPDGRLLASGEYASCIVRIWEPATGKRISQIRLQDEAKDFMTIEGVAFSPDGKLLATGGQSIRLWDFSTRRKVRSFGAGKGTILHLAFSPDGTRLASSADKDTAVRLWNVADGKELRQFGGVGHGWSNLDFSPDGSLLATGDRDGVVHLWDLATGKELRRLGQPLKPGPRSAYVLGALTFSPDGRVVAVGYSDQIVRLLEVASGKERVSFAGHRDGIISVAYSPDGRLLASGSWDRTVMVWDVTGRVGPDHPELVHLDAKTQERVWADLADSDAAKAYQAMQVLLGAEETVSLLRKELRPAVAADPEQLKRLVAELDSDDFAVREQATKDLVALGDRAESVLREAVAKASAEARRRIERILMQIDPASSAELVRGLRAVEVLEWLGTEEAKQLLKTLAAGDPQARLTVQRGFR